jgi:hypothetical protein
MAPAPAEPASASASPWRSLEELEAEAAAWREWGRTQLSSWHEAMKDHVGRHPAQVLGAALLLGVALGWLIKRR